MTKADSKQQWPFDAPNGWDRDVVRLLAWVQKYPHMWLFCSRAKYLELRVDTRDCGFNLYDRDRNPISPDEIVKAIETLRHEFKDDGTMATLEYRQGARQEEPLLDEIERLRASLDPDAFERGRAAGKDEAALEAQYGSFRAHVQAVISEARKVRDALEGDKLVDGLGAALSAHDGFLSAGQGEPARVK